MSISDVPCVFIYSCCDDDPMKTIKLIRNEESIEMCNHEGNILSNRWTIDCKYYTADINLCTSNSLNELSDQFVRSIDAIIILFNIEKSSIIETMDKCLHLVKQSKAEILILLSDKNIDIDTSKYPNANTIFEWCRKNHFELIVLEELAEEMDTTGIERVRQALYAHHWPNLKAKCQITHPNTKAIIEDSVVNCQLSGELSDLNMDTEQETEFDSDLLSDMFEGDINFFKTFDKVRKLKEQISAMPDDERKNAAEKALTECWKAFFGDDVDL